MWSSFFTGNNEILIAGPEVVEYPWTWHEERKKKYFPQGFPAPRCDERGEWILILKGIRRVLRLRVMQDILWMNSRLEVQAGFLRPIYLVLLRISEPP